MKSFQRIISTSQRIRKTPFLITNLSQVSKNYYRLQKALPTAEIFYSIKSNNDPAIISHLHQLGSNFDVASWNEIKKVDKLGVPAKKLIFSSPIKPEQDIKKAYKQGIEKYAYDSFEEAKKIARVAPQAKLILRILVESSGSQCPMFKKFGAYIDEVPELMYKTRSLGLHQIGITFHVGSQCTLKDNWINAIFRANKVWAEAIRLGFKLELVNLGGGLPVKYDEEILPLEEYTQTISREIKKNFSGLKQLYIEPGRYMTDSASVMVATVIGKASRGDTTWIYLDVGGFNGLFEIFEGFKYNIQTDHPDKPERLYAVAGPTCDGMDIIRKEIRLPKVEIGERVYILNAGAYSTSLKQYNGIAWARNITIN